MADEPWGDVPPISADTDFRSGIRRLRAETGRMIGVLDDDPTGSQSVHGIQVVTVPDPAEYPAAFTGSTPTAFVLTNTRSMTEPAAIALNTSVGADLIELAERRGRQIDLVSRGDSTLRGHVFAEIAALDGVRAARGRSHDAVLFLPAYLEAGRVTAGDIHWARVDGRYVPVGQTEFARDVTFGYADSNLREFVMSAARGAIGSERIRSISLGDIRIGGPERVAEILDGADRGDVVVVNALDYSDLEAVAFAALTVEARGKSFLYRTGPVVRTRPRRSGATRAACRCRDLATRPPGSARSHRRRLARRPDEPAGCRVAEGRWVGRGRARCSDVARAGRASATLVRGRGGRTDRGGAQALGRAAVHESDVGLRLGSRIEFAHRAASVCLRVGDREHRALGRTRLGARQGRNHVARRRGHRLGIRRAEVVGQLFAGMVSVYRPISADARAVGRTVRRVRRQRRRRERTGRSGRANERQRRRVRKVGT